MSEYKAYPVSKTVSLWVKILALLILPICLLFISQQNIAEKSEAETASLNQRIEEIHESLGRKLANIESHLDGMDSKIHRGKSSQERLMGMNKNLHDRDMRNQRTIEDQKLRIYKLEKMVADLQFQLRQARGEKQIVDNKIIPFNNVNRDILAYEHRQKVRELKDQQKLELEAFVASHDLSLMQNQKELERLKSDQKIELYTLRRKNEEARRNFRKNKYHQVAMD